MIHQFISLYYVFLKVCFVSLSAVGNIIIHQGDDVLCGNTMLAQYLISMANICLKIYEHIRAKNLSMFNLI